MDIGGGVIVLDDHDEGQALVARGYTRFLDKLYLPVPLDELSPEQIIVINRFREQRISTDGQFDHWRQVRKLFVEALTAAGAQSVIEVGCGKFPICDDISLVRYVGIDIDDEAIENGLARGVQVIEQDGCGSLEPGFQACVSIYAMHFHVEAQSLVLLTQTLEEDALIAFNVIGENTHTSLAAATYFSDQGYLSRIFRGGYLSNKETLFLMAKPAGVCRLQRASEALSHMLFGVKRHQVA